MRKLATVITGAAFWASALWGTIIPPDADLPAEAYILKESGRPEILAAKNETLPIAPASLTKIMTAILAIESGKLQQTVVFPEEATKVEPSKMGAKEGETFRLIDLVKAAMIESDNDAAMAIGIYLGGSVENFARTMNAKARILGMTGTNFTNPCGYDIGDHHSTARDLLRLTDYAIRNPLFNEIAQIDRAVISGLNSGTPYILDTHNKLLTRYKYAIGIKTGYTAKAGPCLIARARYGSKDMIMVLLHTRGDRWKLAGSLFDRAFGIDTQTPLPTVAAPALARSPGHRPAAVLHRHPRPVVATAAKPYRGLHVARAHAKVPRTATAHLAAVRPAKNGHPKTAGVKKAVHAAAKSLRLAASKLNAKKSDRL